MNNSYEITGVIDFIGEVETYNDKKSRSFYLEIRSGKDGEYLNYMDLTMRGEKVSLLDRHKIGDEVTVKFSPGGRKYGNNKVWNSMNAFYVGSVDGQEKPEQQAPPKEMPKYEDIQKAAGSIEAEDIPF